MSTQSLLVDSTAMDHCQVEDPTDEETMTHAEQMNARFEAFKEETRRVNRSYWASVRRAQERLEETKRNQTLLDECPRCGRLDQPSHIPKCQTIKPTDISMEEKIHWRDHGTDWNWDYQATIE
jgi:hypothetical protein